MAFAHNMPEFLGALDAYLTKEIPAIYSRLMRALALDIHGRVVRMTPRDTGRAQNGWAVSVGSPSEFLPAEGAKSYPAASAAEAMAALSSLRFGDHVWVCNNVVYIGRLNQGWSQQAPALFVEQAIEEALSVFERAA